jgi:hypothetical protein
MLAIQLGGGSSKALDHSPCCLACGSDLQVEAIKASTVARQQQLDLKATELQQQQAELNQRLLTFQERVSRTEATLQERQAALNGLQVGGGLLQHKGSSQQQCTLTCGPAC